MGTYGSYVTMFRNVTYLGVRKCGELEVEDAHEPLVSGELWDAVQATLRKRPEKGEQWPKGEQHPMRANSSYLLSGLAVCGVCAAAMVSGEDNVSGNRKSPWPYGLCGRKKREGWRSCPSGKIRGGGRKRLRLGSWPARADCRVCISAGGQSERAAGRRGSLGAGPDR
jgi:hypothetical protein